MSLWERWKKVSINNKLMIYMTAILAVATTLYTLMYRSQVNFMKENATQTAEQTNRLVNASERLAQTTNNTLEEAKRVNKETGDRADRATKAIETQANASMSQANTSQVSARAAEKSAGIAYQSFIATQRPQVFISAAGLHGGALVVGQESVIDLELTNSGPVAAVCHFRDMTFFFNLAPFMTVLEYQHTSKPVTYNLSPTSRVYIHPHFPFPATKERLDAITEGRARLYFYGRGEYRDDLGRTFPLLFCFIYSENVPGKLGLCSDEIIVK
jgi:hypothetical protein